MCLFVEFYMQLYNFLETDRQTRKQIPLHTAMLNITAPKVTFVQQLAQAV